MRISVTQCASLLAKVTLHVRINMLQPSESWHCSKYLQTHLQCMLLLVLYSLWHFW
uniref:Uncharacterized protein n=1 Tax=Arundo donax TaxID=35708 RepID=A0A0A9HHX3_ARUDO